ncbi:hypothetical protein D9M71_304840 [compost metagenome]
MGRGLAQGIAEHGNLLAGPLDHSTHMSDHVAHQRDVFDWLGGCEALQAVPQRLHAFAEIGRGVAGSRQGCAQCIGVRSQLAEAIAHALAQTVDRISGRGHQPAGSAGQIGVARQRNRADGLAQVAYAVAQGAGGAAHILQELAGGESG